MKKRMKTPKWNHKTYYIFYFQQKKHGMTHAFFVAYLLFFHTHVLSSLKHSKEFTAPYQSYTLLMEPFWFSSPTYSRRTGRQTMVCICNLL